MPGPVPGARGARTRACVATLAIALLGTCGFARVAASSAAADSIAPAPRVDAPHQPDRVVMYLARRGWHIDVGFAARDLGPSLAFVARRFPQAKYVFFGFGDRHYLMSKRKGTSTLAGALFPGPGLILVTTIENSPAQAFGEPHVLEFDLAAQQAADAQGFVRRALSGEAGEAGDVSPVAEGPYQGSVYYDAVARYSGLHTCNTWAAEALESAGLKVHTRLVLFAGQIWNQARNIDKRRDKQAATQTSALQGVLAPG